jgi:hypothetical protein
MGFRDFFYTLLGPYYGHLHSYPGRLCPLADMSYQLQVFLMETDFSFKCTYLVGLEINIEKTKYMLLSRHQNVGQNWDIKIANRSLENVSQFKYLGTTVTNQNLMQEEINRRLNSGNACYHSVQNLLSSRLLSKNLKIRIYKTIILPVVLYGCETWSLTLRGEHRLRVFENRVLRRIYCIMRSFVICTLCQV